MSAWAWVEIAIAAPVGFVVGVITGRRYELVRRDELEQLRRYRDHDHERGADA